MTTYRFVHLSDIHFGQEREGELVIHQDVRSRLLADAEALAASRGDANLIVVAGDVAYSAKKDEYAVAGIWLDELSKAVKCRDTDVRLVPGNHDCDRELLTRLARNTQRNIRNGTPKSADADLDDMAKGSDEANPLLPKLKAYREFAAGYESDFPSVSRPCWEKDFHFETGVVFRLVGMNSVQVSDDEDSPGKMVLGNNQYVLPMDDDSVVYGVVMHHPLEWFMDKGEARQYLRNRARLMMVGHEHIPGINKVHDEMGNEWLDIYSGATNPPDPGSYRYTYNWLEIAIRENDSVQSLVVTAFPRVWLPEKTKFAADSQRLGGKESAEFEIRCPGIKKSESRALKRSARAEVRAGTAKAQGRGEAIGIGESMSNEDEVAMAKLKLLFWRYLDWQQRLKVLVRADALPSSADKPVPQTMERLALDAARRRGKLSAVWEAMMEYVPEEKREPNPFTKH